MERGAIGTPLEIEARWAGPGYFHTLAIPVLYGRVFDQRDQPRSPTAIVVNEAFARRFFGTANAVGRYLWLAYNTATPAEIIGVVGNVRSIDMVFTAPESHIYRSAEQAANPPTTLVARTSQSDTALVALLQQHVRRLRPDLPVIQALTMRQRQGLELMPFRVAFGAVGVLGALGVLLASIGLYAVVAYAVAQRTAEIGIRIALGARPQHLTWLVVRDVTALVLTGIAGGTLLAWAAVLVLESSVAPILGVHPLVLAPVTLIILFCGAAAAYLPARRAVRTDPIAAIRRR